MSEPNLTDLRDEIDRAFNEEELRGLCFVLGVEYDSLGGRGKAANVRELVAHCQRHLLLTDLQAALTKARPAVNWSAFFPPSLVATEPQQQKGWEDAAQTYLDKLYAQVNWLHVLGKPEGQPLERIYTDVNVLDKLSAEKRYSLPELEKDFVPRQSWDWRKAERRDGLSVVAQYQRLFILGKPGAGKTTFLKHVAAQTIKQYRQQEGEKKLPIFVSLKELSDSGQPILSFIVGQFGQAGFDEAEAFVRRLLQGDEAVVLFDGLDEVNAEGQQRANLTRAIQYFVDEFDRCRVLVTCRLAAADYLLKRFEYVEMADFDEAQQKTFVFRWFQADRVARDACWQALQGTRNETLRELAQVPMLLSLLCLTFEERKEFPPNRDEIYGEAIRALLLKWDSSRNIQRERVYGALTLKFKERLLAQIAMQTFAGGEYFIPQRRLVALIESYLQGVPGVDDPDGLLVLQAVEAQHGLLVERVHQIHSFSHLTLQEYFAARYYVEHDARDRSMDRLMSHVGDDRWREVFLLTAGMLPDATDFCQQYLAALAQMVAGEARLLALLQWGAGKSADGRSGVKPPARRAFAIYRARGHARARARALALDLAVSNDLSLLIGLPGTTAEIIPYLRRWTGEAGLANVHDALNKLAVPAENAAADAWQTFNQQLEGIILAHWGLDAFWELSREQVNLLVKYLDANLLLVECMALAYLPDREWLENQLLLPPGDNNE